MKSLFQWLWHRIRDLRRVTLQLNILLGGYIVELGWEALKWKRLPTADEFLWILVAIALRLWIPKMENKAVNDKKRKGDRRDDHNSGGSSQTNGEQPSNPEEVFRKSP